MTPRDYLAAVHIDDLVKAHWVSISQTAAPGWENPSACCLDHPGQMENYRVIGVAPAEGVVSVRHVQTGLVHVLAWGEFVPISAIILPGGKRYNGTLRFDDMERPVVEFASCGHCGFVWNDALSTAVTPAPSARCPNEYDHVYDDTPDPDRVAGTGEMVRLRIDMYEVRVYFVGLNQEDALNGGTPFHSLEAAVEYADQQDDPNLNVYSFQALIDPRTWDQPA